MVPHQKLHRNLSCIEPSLWFIGGDTNINTLRQRLQIGKRCHERTRSRPRLRNACVPVGTADATSSISLQTVIETSSTTQTHATFLHLNPAMSKTLPLGPPLSLPFSPFVAMGNFLVNFTNASPIISSRSGSISPHALLTHMSAQVSTNGVRLPSHIRGRATSTTISFRPSA